MSHGQGPDDPAGIDFLDFVFTLAMSIGLSPGILAIEGYKGIVAEEWLKSGSWPGPAECFNLFVFLLCFCTLMLSWFGYHASIKKKPLEYNDTPGMLRFILDVFLVVIYGFLFLQFKNFNYILLLLVLIHFLFVVWDYLKVSEHKSKYLTGTKYDWRKFRREFVTLTWFIMFLLLYLLSGAMPKWAALWTGGLPTWLSLLLAFTFTFGYRINKMHSFFIDRLITNRWTA